MASHLDLPEVCQLDHGPEVYISTELELLRHDSSACLPQVCYGQGLERYERKERAGHAEPDKLRGKAARRKKKWRWIVLVLVIVIIIAAIGGAIGATFGRKSSSSSASTPTSLTSSPASSAQPPSIPASNSSAGLVHVGPTILSNSSIAATTCPNGDRWVFMQDVNGNIRGCQFSLQTSKWSITTSSAIGVTGSSRTPLSASCVNIPASIAGEGLNPGLQITVVYLNNSNILQQAQYSEGAWSSSIVHLNSHSQDLPAPPANLTKLAISSALIQLGDAPNPSTTTDQKPYFSSVLVYQDQTGRYIMLDLAPPVGSKTYNLFSQLKFSTPQDNSSTVGASLACIHNGQASTTSAQLFTQCQLGQVEHVWTYNVSAINSSTTFLDNSGVHDEWNTSTRDVSMAQLREGNLAMVYLADNNIISVEMEGVAVPNFSNGDPAQWPTAIPFSHISATSLAENSTVFYVYYQANDTSIAETSFDVDSGFWATRPGYFSLP